MLANDELPRERLDPRRDKSFRVLDAGAGDAPYRELFDHVMYESADFAAVSGKNYGALDFVCDLGDLPMSDATYDLVICNQVLEHLTEPLVVPRELRRVVKPGCQVWLSAPLFYEEHEQPYDFHRYTQFAWRWMAEATEMEIISLDWLEGYAGTLAYQMDFAVRQLPHAQRARRVLFAALARHYSRQDRRLKDTSFGMPKNYTCVMQRPLASGAELETPTA